MIARFLLAALLFVMGWALPTQAVTRTPITPSHLPTLTSSQGITATTTFIILSSGLDEHILRTMRQVMRQSPYQGSHVTWLFKLDRPARDLEGIRRWALPAGTTAPRQLRTQVIAPGTTPICDAELITSFIDWSVEHYPAQQYILVMSGHAVGWLPSADTTGLRTPGALFDATISPHVTHPCYLPDYGLSLSLYDQIRALQCSQFIRQGGRFRLVLHDACLMGRAEVISEYAQVADYMIATPEQLLDAGTPYAELLHLFSQSSSGGDEAEFRRAASRYIDYTTSHGWQANADEQSTSCYSASLFLCDLCRFDRVVKVVRSIADELVAPTPGFEYAYLDALPQTHTNALMYTDDLPRAAQMNSFDLYHFSTLLAATGSPRMQALHDSLSLALDDCLYLRAARRPADACPIVLSPIGQSPFAQVSLSFSLFAWGRYPDVAQLACYRRTRFCQLTGLDRFFLINTAQPIVGRTSFPALYPPQHTQ